MSDGRMLEFFEANSPATRKPFSSEYLSKIGGNYKKWDLVFEKPIVAAVKQWKKPQQNPAAFLISIPSTSKPEPAADIVCACGL
jgi:hypothetical protein